MAAGKNQISTTAYYLGHFQGETLRAKLRDFVGEICKSNGLEGLEESRCCAIKLKDRLVLLGVQTEVKLGCGGP